MYDVHYVMVLPFSAQIPNQITLSSAEHFTPVIPVEVAGWWIKRLNLGTGDWTFILTSDNSAQLAVHVITRLNMGLNIVNGANKMGNAQVVPTVQHERCMYSPWWASHCAIPHSL